MSRSLQTGTYHVPLQIYEEFGLGTFLVAISVSQRTMTTDLVWLTSPTIMTKSSRDGAIYDFMVMLLIRTDKIDPRVFAWRTIFSRKLEVTLTRLYMKICRKISTSLHEVKISLTNMPCYRTKTPRG